MWTVIVEVHLKGKSTVFQLGSFPFAEDAAAFADTLNWELGEDKITATIIRHQVLFEWMTAMLKRGKSTKPYRSEVNYPPCLEDE